MGINYSLQTHGVVKSGLDIAGAPGSRPVKITDTDCDGLCSAFEIRTDRCSEDPELVLIRRLYTYDGIRAEHEGPYIERGARAKGRYIVLVCLDCLTYGIQKSILWKGRHLKPFSRVDHPVRIKVRPEGDGTPVLSGIGLKPFKYSLRILKNTGTLA